MAYKITYKKSFQKDLKHLPKDQFEKILERIDQVLSVDPYSCPQLTAELKGLRRLRVGDYRVLFRISGNEVLIVRIANRKDVYR